MEKDSVAPNRNTERWFLLFATILLSLFFFRLYTVLQTRFADVDARLKDGTMINLNAKNPAASIRHLLEKGYYFDDKRDIDLIEATVAGALKPGEQIDNVGELNKRRFDISADEAYAKGGESFKSRVEASRSLLGYTGDDSLRFHQEVKNPPQLPTINDLKLGSHSMSGSIFSKDVPVPGVLVKLELILPQDSIFNSELTEDIKFITTTVKGATAVYMPDSAGKRHLQELSAYARTDEEGHFEFKNLPDNKAFKVLPLQPGYQFGASQGVQNLDDDASFTFQQRPHTIRLFSTRDFNILKKERSLLIRTPQEFNAWFLLLLHAL